MRHLIIILLLATSASAEALSLDDLAIQHFPSAELFEEVTEKKLGMHLIPLGALEVISQELVPEESQTVMGYKSYRTYALPEARRTATVAEFYAGQLAALGDILYQCKGRSCGSSSFWANNIFKQRVLYGPEQYQYYYIVELSDSGDLLKFYIGERATRKIYVHIELVRRHQRESN